jgi:hypothetical protein
VTLSPTEAPEPAAAPRKSWGWALRRAAVGLAMLTLFVVASAWLLHASIDPDAAAASDTASEE